MYESIMTLRNILSFVKILHGIFEMFYALQIALNMSMPTLHTPDKTGYYLIERIMVTTTASKQAPNTGKVSDPESLSFYVGFDTPG